jgi:hypothetical protein
MKKGSPVQRPDLTPQREGGHPLKALRETGERCAKRCGHGLTPVFTGGTVG